MDSLPGSTSTTTVANNELFRAYYRRVARVIQSYSTSSGMDSSEPKWGPTPVLPVAKYRSVRINLTEFVLTDSIEALFDRLFLLISPSTTSNNNSRFVD